MKILHIIDSGGLYGAEMVLLNLIAEQIELGIDPLTASIGEKGDIEKPVETEALARGFKVKKFRMRPGPNLIGALKILRFAHEQGFDVMHSHGYKGNILFGFMPRQFRKLPLVTTIHGWTNTNTAFTKMRLYEWLDAKSLKYIDMVVLVSQAMKSHPKLKARKAVNFHVIHNGIPIPQPNQQTFTPLNPKAIQLGQQTQVTQEIPILDQEIIDFCSAGYTIGSIGRLSPEKGFTNLVEAVKIICSTRNDMRLVIIGEGPERESIQNRIHELGLRDRVLLPGYRSCAKSYLPYFKIFALSSFTEGLPITILEAMQARVPIISTRVGGVPEVLQNGKAGILVDTPSGQALAEAINKLISFPELGKQILDKAKTIVKRHYSSQNMAVQYLSLYSGLM